jgi:CheY-like chemotaxis protein
MATAYQQRGNAGQGAARQAFASDFARAAKEPAEADQINARSFKDITVLVVEDDTVTRESLADIFAHFGAQVLSADCMGAALNLYEENSPALIVSDIGLLQGDGFMLLRAVRAREGRRGGHVAAIAISGFPSRECSERASQAGFDAFLRKPVDIGVLLRLASALVNA